jgi:hypothetical protein
MSDIGSGECLDGIGAATLTWCFRIRFLPQPVPTGGSDALQHVPEKLIDFSDKNMLQHFDFELFLLDRMISSGRKTL